MILVAVFAIVLHPMVCAGDSTSTVDKRRALKGCHTIGGSRIRLMLLPACTRWCIDLSSCEVFYEERLKHVPQVQVAEAVKEAPLL